MKIGDKIKVRAPEGVFNSFTEGKTYEGVIEGERRRGCGFLFTVTNDYGEESTCLEFNCAHLRGMDWIIVEDKIMIKRKRKLIAIAPKGCRYYLIPGKEYEIIRTIKTNEYRGLGFYILDENKEEAFCIEFGCSHLKGQDWTILGIEE